MSPSSSTSDRSHGSAIFGVLVLVVLLAVGLSGCEQQSQQGSVVDNVASASERVAETTETVDLSGLAGDVVPVMLFAGPESKAGAVTLTVEILDQKEVRIEGDKGGKVELQDGFILTLPPGALNTDSDLSVQHAFADKRQNSLVADFEFYRIVARQNGSKLLKPATLQFRCDPQKPGQDELSQVRVIHRLPSGEIQQLVPEVDAERQILAVQVDSFRDFWFWWPNSEWKKARDVKAGKDPNSVLLQVGYYSQGPEHEWCWAACASMLASAHGSQLQPQEVAEVYKATRSQLKSLAVDLPLAKLEKEKFSNQLHFETKSAGFLLQEDLQGYLMNQLDDKRPVWVLVPGSYLKQLAANIPFSGTNAEPSHYVLLVGYDQQHFYVHDPNGALIERIPGTTFNERHLCYQPVTYEEWSRINEWKGSITNLAFVRQPASDDPRTLTLQVLPNGGLSFSREHASPNETTMHWNGHVPGGCGFSVMDENAGESLFGREGLCNSDRISKLRVMIHNARMGEFQETLFNGRVELWLINAANNQSGQLGKAKEVRKIQGSTTNNLEDLLLGKNAAGAPAAPDGYVELDQRGDVSLRDALDFTTRPLRPGDYVLEVRLHMESGDQLLDRVRVPFKMRPAVVPQPVVTQVTNADGEVVHRIVWKPSAEELRVASSRMEYIVYRTVRNGSDVEPKEILDSPVRRLPDGSYATDSTMPNPAHQIEYQVSAVVDRKRDLASPLSQPAEVKTPEKTSTEKQGKRYKLVFVYSNAMQQDGTKWARSYAQVPVKSPFKWKSTEDQQGGLIEAVFTFPDALAFDHYVQAISSKGTVCRLNEEKVFSVRSVAHQARANRSNVKDNQISLRRDLFVIDLRSSIQLINSPFGYGRKLDENRKTTVHGYDWRELVKAGDDRGSMSYRVTSPGSDVREFLVASKVEGVEQMQIEDGTVWSDQFDTYIKQGAFEESQEHEVRMPAGAYLLPTTEPKVYSVGERKDVYKGRSSTPTGIKITMWSSLQNKTKVELTLLYELDD